MKHEFESKPATVVTVAWPFGARSSCREEVRPVAMVAMEATS